MAGTDEQHEARRRFDEVLRERVRDNREGLAAALFGRREDAEEGPGEDDPDEAA